MFIYCILLLLLFYHESQIISLSRARSLNDTLSCLRFFFAYFFYAMEQYGNFMPFPVLTNGYLCLFFGMQSQQLDRAKERFFLVLLTGCSVATQQKGNGKKFNILISLKLNVEIHAVFIFYFIFATIYCIFCYFFFLPLCFRSQAPIHFPRPTS